MLAARSFVGRGPCLFSPAYDDARQGDRATVPETARPASALALGRSVPTSGGFDRGLADRYPFAHEHKTLARPRRADVMVGACTDPAYAEVEVTSCMAAIAATWVGCILGILVARIWPRFVLFEVAAGVGGLVGLGVFLLYRLFSGT